jgi:hypothetical protein
MMSNGGCSKIAHVIHKVLAVRCPGCFTFTTLFDVPRDFAIDESPDVPIEKPPLPPLLLVSAPTNNAIFVNMILVVPIERQRLQGLENSAQLCRYKLEETRHDSLLPGLNQGFNAFLHQIL